MERKSPMIGMLSKKEAAKPKAKISMILPQAGLTSISPLPFLHPTPDLVRIHSLDLEVRLMQVLGRSNRAEEGCDEGNDQRQSR
jgi:hypothetical protein